jgi:dTDP-4-amino-4,6-dideoxygalactose transaminase
MPDRTGLGAGPGHPDRRWLASVRAALDAWERSPTGRPTSSVFGGGAIAAAEAAFSDRHGGRPALLLPSATYALRVALQVLAVGQGDEVLCAAVDWPAGLAAVVSLGAVPVTVAVDPGTLTMDPAAAAKARTGRTRAAIACHLHGICADVPALRDALPGVGIVEDAAQAFGCALDGRLAGTWGDLAVLSLGPGKQLDAGEGGVLLCADEAGYSAAVGLACHPLRQLVAGVSAAPPDALAMRPHPLTAVLALHALAGWSAEPSVRAQALTRAALVAVPGLRVLGDPDKHRNTSGLVPVLLDQPDRLPPPGTAWVPSGARVLPGGPPGDRTAAAALLARTRLAAAS